MSVQLCFLLYGSDTDPFQLRRMYKEGVLSLISCRYVSNTFSHPFVVHLFCIATCRDSLIDKNFIFHMKILIVEKIPVGISSFVRKYIGLVQNNAHNYPKTLAQNCVEKLPIF